MHNSFHNQDLISRSEYFWHWITNNFNSYFDTHRDALPDTCPESTPGYVNPANPVFPPIILLGYLLSTSRALGSWIIYYIW